MLFGGSLLFILKLGVQGNEVRAIHFIRFVVVLMRVGHCTYLICGLILGILTPLVGSDLYTVYISRATMHS
jgi:thiamine transporter ThiT